MFTRRLALISTTEQLAVSPEAKRFAEVIMQQSELPPKALDDAGHVAIAAVNGTEYLTTWNLRHLANVAIRRTIEETCRSNGYAVPMICTPEQLIEPEENEHDI